jgi:hypothetical protein
VIHPLGVGLPWLRDRIADVVHLEKAQTDGSLLRAQVLRQLALRFAHLVGVHHRTRSDGCQRPVHDILQHGDAPIPLSDRQVEHTLGDGGLELLYTALKCDHLRSNGTDIVGCRAFDA